MVGKYYYHGTDFNGLKGIFSNYGIKCRRLIEEENISITRTTDVTFGDGYNGYEYISLCRLCDESFKCDSAYDVFIRNNFCVIVSNDISAIKTIDSTNPIIKTKYEKEILDFCLNKNTSKFRFSDMKDEWQVKTMIPFDKIIGIGIPLNHFKYNAFDGNIKEVNLLLEMAFVLGLDVVDTSEYKFAYAYEKEKETKKEVVKIRKIQY